MKQVKIVAMSVYLAAVLVLPVWAQNQELIVYPNKGQSQQQQQQDQFECYQWAKGETGFDPMQIPTATAPPPQMGAPQGGLIKGAAGGAALGAVGGAIGGDAGKGAAIGAGVGGLFGMMRRQDQVQQQQQAQQQWEQNQTAQYTQKRNYYNRAYSACLQGRGYTVN